MEESSKSREINNMEELNAYIGNEENQKKALRLAYQIYDVMGDQWFTVNKLAKEVNDSATAINAKLEVLNLFCLCISKETNKNTKFKIVFDNSHELALIDEELEYMESKKEYLKKRKEHLKKIVGKFDEQ